LGKQEPKIQSFGQFPVLGTFAGCLRTDFFEVEKEKDVKEEVVEERGILCCCEFEEVNLKPKQRVSKLWNARE